jgi:hypothetical protein
MDPAGWYPDPVGCAEHRYWDGLAWTATVSTSGTEGQDVLGGEPLPTPTEAAQLRQPSEPEHRSNRRLIVSIVAVVAVIGAAFAVVLTRDNGASTPTLSAQPLNFDDNIDDIGHLPFHRVSIPANTVTFIDIRTTDTTLQPIVVIEASKQTSDQIATTLLGATNQSTELSDVFPDLREEDLGVQGTVVVFACAPKAVNGGFFAVMPSPVASEYDVVPVLLDGTGNSRRQGTATVTLKTRPFDYSNLPTAADVARVFQSDPVLGERSCF